MNLKKICLFSTFPLLLLPNINLENSFAVPGWVSPATLRRETYILHAHRRPSQFSGKSNLLPFPLCLRVLPCFLAQFCIDVKACEWTHRSILLNRSRSANGGRVAGYNIGQHNLGCQCAGKTVGGKHPGSGSSRTAIEDEQEETDHKVPTMVTDDRDETVWMAAKRRE